jgi:tRNA(Ile2) C34 agmatinyltransferase TiaS
VVGVEKDALDAERFLRCPKCQAVAATADTLGRSVVYIRCTACGETWTIPERRKAPRDTDRKPRFPVLPDD